jgi:predicted aconitase
MHITLRMAAIQQAKELINVSQAHIDACVYSGKSSLLFAETLAAWGAQVKVPTTLNALSVDKRRWVEQGVDREFGTAASAVGDAYKAMGAQPTYTCAPYLLASTPKCGEHVVWAESNAVAYVNSVVGARTQKYPDFLDIFIALTGRAPAATAHLDSGRLPHLSIEVDAIENPDDSFWPLLGYHVGIIAISNIPLVFGLEELAPTPDDLKAFSAAFATTSAMPMFHLYGVTPEAAEAEAYLNKAAAQSVSVTLTDLQATWLELNSAEDPAVGLICIGNPHVSVTELKSLAELCHARQKHPDVGVIVTLGREVHEDAMNAGYTQQLEDFGVQFINDTCWCMITEPVIPKSVKVLMTNSGKYAHYGPGLVQRDVHFGSMGECIDVACTGYRDRQFPTWLSSH